MSKLLYFGVPAAGHVNPMLPVLSELVKRGENVVAYNSEAYRAKFEQTGATFKSYPTMAEAEELMKHAGAGNFARNGLKFLQITQKTLPLALDDIQRERPDAVLYDSLATWGRAAAEKLNHKTIAFLSTFVLTPPIALSIMPMSALFNMMWRSIPYMPQTKLTERALQREFGVPAHTVANPLAQTGQLNVIFTARDLQPKNELFGDDYAFIGAAVTERDDKLDFTLDDRPVVYISLGTINNQNVEFYRQCFEAFADYPAQFVMSVGKQTDIKSLGTIPANFIVRNFVAQLELLKRTTVYISHSGMNSVHESLFYGVPLILVPQQAEQLIVSMQIEKIGAGEVLGRKPPFGKTTAAELRAALEKVMANHGRYQEKARWLGDKLRAAGGVERAADEIIRFAQT